MGMTIQYGKVYDHEGHRVQVVDGARVRRISNWGTADYRVVDVFLIDDPQVTFSAGVDALAEIAPWPVPVVRADTVDFGDVVRARCAALLSGGRFRCPRPARHGHNTCRDHGKES